MPVMALHGYRRRMQRDRERLAYLFGEEALDEVDAYDLSDESDVMELVERFLPEPPGAEPNAARMAMRSVAVRQIFDDTPPEAWQTVQRLQAAGHARDEVISQLSMTIGEHIVQMLGNDSPSDKLVAAFAALPLPDAAEVAAAVLAVARAEPGLTRDEHLARTRAALESKVSTRILDSLIDGARDELIEHLLHRLADDATVVFHDTIAGRAFTHRLTENEHEIGVLSASFDLAAFGRFDVVRLPGGDELQQVSARDGHLAWMGPEGWLDAFQPGGLLAVTAAFELPAGNEPVEATVTITVVADEPAMTDDLTTAVRAAYDAEHGRHGLPVNSEHLALWLCHHRPELFTTALPPLIEWCAAAGLDTSGNLIVHDAAVWRRSRAADRIDHIEAIVDDERARAVLCRAVEVLDDPDASVDDVRSALADSGAQELLDVLADVVIPERLSPEREDEFIGPDGAGHVFALVERATAVARRSREVAAAEYLACVMRERCGQPLIAAEHLARVVEAQPRLGPAVERMGWYCFDRGDARGALRWWGELGAPHPAARTIEAFAGPSGRAKLGRNEPCWCGSGRKFKQCHQGSDDLVPLPDRVTWLCRKATMWIEHAVGEARELVTGVVLAWVAGDPDVDGLGHVLGDLEGAETRERFAAAFADPIVFDAALHEGGLFAWFLRERGDLLPADERMLAESWSDIDRSVHEVIAVERGVGMTLRDLDTGGLAEVRERSASRRVEVGEHYCARVVPDGVTHQLIGGALPVRAGYEEAVLAMCAEGDPMELCAWAGALASSTLGSG